MKWLSNRAGTKKAMRAAPPLPASSAAVPDAALPPTSM